MKKYLFFVLWGMLCLGFFLSCSTNNENLRRIEEIKEHGNSNPKEALQELDSLSSVVANESKHVRNLYDLLRIRLQDKADIIPESDEKPKSLYDYFMECGNNREKQEACYYLASTYRDLHDTPRALQYFLEALSIAETSEQADSVIFTNTYSQLAAIYIRQYDYKSAMEASEKELALAKELNIVDPIYIMNAASSAFALNDTVKTLKYQKEALNMIIQHRQENLYPDILCEILYNLSSFELMSEATQCKHHIDSLKCENIPYNYYASLAKYYMCLEKTDSAIRYYHLLLEQAPNIRQEFNAARNLAVLYDKKGNMMQANKYALLFIDTEAKYRRLLQHDRVINAHNEYIYNRNKAEEAKAYKAATQAKTQKTHWIFAFIMLLTLSVVFVLIQRNRNLKRVNKDLRIISDMEGELKEKKQVIKEKEERIQEKQKRIRLVTKELKEKENELANKNKELQDRKDLLKQKDTELRQVETMLHEKEKILIEKIEQNEKLFRFAFTENIEQNAHEIIEKFHKAARGTHRLSGAEWKQLFSAIEEIYPQFRNAVMQKIKKPTEDKLQIAYLLKAGMNKPQIINLTGFPTTSVWRKVKALKEILGDDLMTL